MPCRIIYIIYYFVLLVFGPLDQYDRSLIVQFGGSSQDIYHLQTMISFCEHYDNN